MGLGEVCLVLLLLGGMALLGYWMSNRRRFAQLARLPGPRALPIIGNFFDIVNKDAGVVQSIMKLAKCYDGPFRLWMGSVPAVVIMDPDHLQTYYTSPSLLDRAETMYSIIADVVGQSILVANGQQWKNLRKMFLLSFNNNSQLIQKENVQESIKIAMEMLRHKADGPAFPCNFVLLQTTGRSVFMNVLGMKISDDKLDEILHDIMFLMKACHLRNFSTIYYCNVLFYLSPLGRRFQQKKKDITHFLHEDITRKKAEMKEMEKNGKSPPNLYIYNLIKNLGHEPMDVLVGEVFSILAAVVVATQLLRANSYDPTIAGYKLAARRFTPKLSPLAAISPEERLPVFSLAKKNWPAIGGRKYRVGMTITTRFEALRKNLPKKLWIVIGIMQGAITLRYICFDKGMDTTSGTVGFALTCLGLYPDVQQKVYEEDQKILKRLNGKEPDLDDLKEYKYFDRFLKETLRIFPAEPIIGRRVHEDTFFGKHLVPKGTDIFALVLYQHMNPKFFPNPEKFDPDHFLPENVEKLHPYAYAPFSAGPRGCPGKRYAMLALNLIITSIVREFQVFSDYTSLEEALRHVDLETMYKDKLGNPIRLVTRNPVQQ